MNFPIWAPFINKNEWINSLSLSSELVLQGLGMPQLIPFSKAPKVASSPPPRWLDVCRSSERPPDSPANVWHLERALFFLTKKTEVYWRSKHYQSTKNNIYNKKWSRGISFIFSTTSRSPPPPKKKGNCPCFFCRSKPFLATPPTCSWVAWWTLATSPHEGAMLMKSDPTVGKKW